MSHTYTDLLTHIVFSTEERKPFLADEIRPEVHAYLGGIVRQLHGVAIIIGGARDHVHVLACLPGDICVSECVRTLKSNSSRWAKERWSGRQSFAWQTGCGAFSVSESARKRVIEYIARQEEHHHTISFQDEFISLLRKHHINYDERYIWD